MRCFLLVFAVILTVAAPSAADTASASASVVVGAQFATRTSLKVSSELLQFTVPTDGEAVRVGVDFTAAARTRSGGEVILLVEAMGPIGEGSEGECDVAFATEGQGASSGMLAVAGATPVARWIGSGVRTGRVTFTLRAAAGLHLVPVRFLLTAP